MKSNLVDLTVMLHIETKPGIPDEGALLVSETEDSKRIWIPKSLCEWIVKKDDIIILTLPEKIAHEKGLI